MNPQDYYKLPKVDTELIKGISTKDNHLVEKMLKNGAQHSMVVDLHMITGSGAKIFMERFTPLSIALKYKNEYALRALLSYGAKKDSLFINYIANIEPGQDGFEELLRLSKIPQ